MDRSSQDRIRLLASSIVSDEDLEAYSTAGNSQSASYIPTAGSYRSSPRSSMTKYKRLPKYDPHAPTGRSTRRSYFTLKHACSVLALFTAILVAFCLGAVLSVRVSVLAKNWSRKPPLSTRPRVVGLVFCQYLCARRIRH